VFDGKSILVTGGTGSFGKSFIRILLQRYRPRRVVVYSRDELKQFEMQQEFNDDCMRYFIGDVRDRDRLIQAMRGVDYVLHQAAIPSVQRSVEDPLATDYANVRGTLQLLIAAREAGVRRFVFASSSAVYGESEALPKREEMPLFPLSPYGVSKLAGESYCRAFHRVYGLPTVALRYFNVFGPRQDPQSQYAAVIPLFITALLEGRRPTIYGDGRQSRDFSYVSNIVEANLLACEAPGIAGEVFNIACQQQHSLLDVLNLLNELLGTETQPLFAPARPGDIRHSLADISKARRLMGYTPTVNLREGLAKTVEWYRRRLTTT